MMRRFTAVCGDGTRFIKHAHVFRAALFSARFRQHLVGLGGVAIRYRGAGGAKIFIHFVRRGSAAARRLHADDAFAIDGCEHDAARPAVART
ncbi:hypothetical protein NLM27_14685 [Bradyrhizobium sp. CCGB12]|uniref:hypothetical protein n=1 Tax=Bradyrhizobium sp. CCGB12 TaxID=2949632 RepID=UPI0020B2557B|nr:hypothetical protein [Bradyrhizobium sp. CCGB12]MCP3390023.1 hypothetical protein [Bradyrhizobium sp. CCGB12]